MIRRFLCIFCAFALLMGLCPAAFALGNHSPWASEELTEMDALGLIPSRIQDKADLTQAATRLEMCTVAVRALEHYEGQDLPTSNATPYWDCNDPVVLQASESGLMNGYADGSFRPETPMTRQEFFVLVQRFFTACGWIPPESAYGEIGGFADAAEVAPWAFSAAQLMVGIGAVKGNGHGIDPKGTASCEQALLMFYRSYRCLEEHKPGFSMGDKYPNLQPWAARELQPMEQKGMIPDILLGRDMQSPMTRQEMCHLAMESFLTLCPGYEPPWSLSVFPDTDDYRITEAYYLALVSGYSDGSFCPDQSVSRQQFYKLMGNFLLAIGYPRFDSPETDLSRFADAGDLQEYAKPSVRLLVELGVLKGDNSGCLWPNAAIPCQEALALFYRTYQKMEQWLLENNVHCARDLAENLVDYAVQFEGLPYVWGGTDPETGFDCSGLVYHVYRQYGFPVGRVAEEQWEYPDGWEVPLESALPGDLLIFSESSSLDDITHIGICVDRDNYLHAANSNRGVVIDWLHTNYVHNKCVAVLRLIP